MLDNRSERNSQSSQHLAKINVTNDILGTSADRITGSVLGNTKNRPQDINKCYTTCFVFTIAIGMFQFGKETNLLTLRLRARVTQPIHRRLPDKRKLD